MELAEDENPEPIGVQQVESENPVISIVNSTNIRLGHLTDQHNQHRKEVAQLFIAGGCILLVQMLFNICLCGVLACRYCRKRKADIQLSRQPSTFRTKV